MLKLSSLSNSISPNVNNKTPPCPCSIAGISEECCLGESFIEMWLSLTELQQKYK